MATTASDHRLLLYYKVLWLPAVVSRAQVCQLPRGVEGEWIVLQTVELDGVVVNAAEWLEYV